jgi:hypothetical protein
MTRAQSPLEIEWNKMVDYLASIRPSGGDGVLMTQTASGVSFKSKSAGRGQTQFIRVCKRDGTERYIPFLVVGDDIAEADLPPGANVFDPP